MNCERVKEFILTDYTDGQLSAQWQEEIKTHVDHCAACRDFAQEVKAQLITPFHQLPVEKPSESVWLAIKANIQPVANEEPQESLIDKLSRLVFVFRPVLITACVFLIIGAVVLNNKLGVKHQPYMSYLMSDDVSSNDTVSSIERYFL